MDKLFLNVAGIIGVITAIIFIARFYKNHHVVEQQPSEEVKMKVKINLEKPKQNFDNFSQKKTSNTVKTSNKIRDPVYFSFNTNNIIKDDRLEFLGRSIKTGYPIYAMDKANTGILKGTKFIEILNIDKELKR